MQPSRRARSVKFYSCLLHRIQAVFERAESLDFGAVAIRDDNIFGSKLTARKIYGATHKNRNHADRP